jgi:hypothetical protein
MPTRNVGSRRPGRKSLGEAITTVGWQKLLLWPAVAAVGVAVAANTFGLIVETLLPPSMARGTELVPYFGGIFLATVVGQILGPYAGLRRQLEKLGPGYRVWFKADNPLAKLNRVLWNMGTEAQAASFQGRVHSRTDEFAGGPLDEARTRLLTAVSKNLESVPKLFHVRGVNRDELAEFGTEPTEDCLVSLARGLREAGWGRVELRPGPEWLSYSPMSIVGTLALLAPMMLLLTLAPVSGQETNGLGAFFNALVVQWPFYFIAIAGFMLRSAGRPSEIVKSALPAGLRAGNLDESLDLARDPFQRMRLFLGALPPDDRRALLEATHFALWKALRTFKTGLKRRRRNAKSPENAAAA